MARLTDVLPVPAVTLAGEAAVVVVPLANPESVPYLKVTAVVKPLSLTVPCRVDPVVVMLSAALLVAVGGTNVVKLTSAP